MRLILLTIFILTLQSCSNTTNKEQAPDNTFTETLPQYTEEEKRTIIENIKKIMSDFSDENAVRDLEDAKFQLRRLGLAWYQCSGQLVAEKADITIWKMKDTAIAVLSQYQTKMFPKYRKAFVDETDKKLWIEDCSAYIDGDNDDELNLIGVVFAPNRRKQEYYETLLEVLKQYRFKKVTFRVFKSSTDITSFDITSIPDTDNVPSSRSSLQ